MQLTEAVNANKFSWSKYKKVFHCETFFEFNYPELHKASHQFADEKGRTANDKQLFGINGHKCGHLFQTAIIRGSS